jgi:hypothetical protein
MIRYSQSAYFGNTTGNWQTATPSGELDYYNGHHSRPFSLIYAGGYTWTLSGPTQYSTGFFQHLSVHQAMSTGKWKGWLGDDVSYRPQAPITGFSGIPGTGEPIGVPTPPPSQTILNLGTHALDNLAAGELSRILSPVYTVSAGAKYDLLFFPDSNGIDTNNFSAHSELTRQISRRSSIFGEYIFNRFSYPDFNFAIYANSLMAGYEHSFSRRFHINLGVGPAWVTSSDSKTVPASTLVNANAQLNYQMRTGSMFVAYDRSTNGGSGYLLGQLTDSVDAGYSREFARTFTAEVKGGYNRVQPLNKNPIIQSELGAVQGSFRLGRSLSGFANYTIITQSSEGQLPSTAVNGPLQSISFGIAYKAHTRRRY